MFSFHVKYALETLRSGSLHSREYSKLDHIEYLWTFVEPMSRSRLRDICLTSHSLINAEHMKWLIGEALLRGISDNQ